MPGHLKAGREWAKVTAQCWKFSGQPKWKAHTGLDVLVCTGRRDLGVVSLWKVPEARETSVFKVRERKRNPQGKEVTREVGENP